MKKDYLKPEIECLNIIAPKVSGNTEIGVGSGELPEVEEDW